jgi:hypothetical protein
MKISTDLTEFSELEKHAPKVICPECKCQMTIMGMSLGNKADPFHEIEYDCWAENDCATTLTLFLNPDFTPRRAAVTTGNHGYQEMYDAQIPKIIKVEVE